jgi:hypothetical protein
MFNEIINGVFDLSDRILENTPHVSLNHDRIKELAKIMVSNPRSEKQVDAEKIKSITDDRNSMKQIVLKELVADSINYCYWQYNSKIRPFGAGSTKMRQLLDESFNAAHALQNSINFNYQIRIFIRTLQRHRFPLMDKRIQHLKALCDPYYMRGASNLSAYTSGQNVATVMTNMVVEKYNFDHLFDFLITEIDGFGDDPFLKRACLFFIQLNRILGMFEKEIKMFPIPADYQVPKMMHHYKLFDYSGDLEFSIQDGEHLPENGQREMAIRAATVATGLKLCMLTGWSAAEVDGWFFSKKNECYDNFHLCKTSNY